MKNNILKFTDIKRVVFLLILVLFIAASCEDDILQKQEKPQVSVSFTPCQQNKKDSSEHSDKVDVNFTNNAVQITYHNFEVPCDFTTVNVTHTFANGVLNITQQSSPNKTDCICYTDVSYTINEISVNEINVIFINAVQVYCYNENYPIEISFEDYSLVGSSCQWTNLAYNNTVVIINSQKELNQYVACISDNYPEIDFSKYTLLLAHGKAPSSVVYMYSNCNKLLQYSEQSYKMNVDISVGYATVVSNWQIPIIINKLNKECTIELIVTIK